jgi:multidrug efflux pump
VLALVFLPALYVTWFRIKAPSKPEVELPVPEAVHEPA